MTPIEIGQAVAIAAIAVIVFLERRKERRAKRKGLPPNPERCEDMAKRMKAVEDDIAIIRDDIKYIMDKT